MTEKEATVYIVDMGRSMGARHNGRKESDLDWAMTYVWDKITSTVRDPGRVAKQDVDRKQVALDRKTATLVGTENELDSEDSFEHICLKRLGPLITVSETNNGDAISAIVIAIQMIAKYCKKLKYKRKIVLVTDGRGTMEEDPDGIQEISKKIKADEMELVVIGVDFDDPDYGFKEEDKSEEKSTNESTLKALVEDCEGVYGTMQEAIEELGKPRLKNTRPVPSYKGQLTLGNPEEYNSALCIDVERFPRIMIRRPLSASQYVQRTDLSGGEASTQSSATMLPDVDGDIAMTQGDQNALTSVRNARTYQVLDKEAPGGKRDVSRDDLAKGYEYGRTAVHISESDLNVTKLETHAAFDIIGFVPWETYERYMSMSVSCVVIAQKTNSKAIMALSSLIHSLFELESYAVARLVTKDDKEPVITLLAPSIEVDYECLLDVQLPFTEDVRSYRFPPLDKVITVSGKEVKEHRNLPNDALSAAMSDYVDRMDLSKFGTDDEGNEAEYMPMTDTYSPVLHRIDQAVRWRAVHATEPVPPPYDIFTRYSKPPDELVAKAKRQLDKLVAAADVKKVPPKAQSRKRNRNEIKPLSGLNVSALLGTKPKKLKITPENPIPEFRQALDAAESHEAFVEAAQQLGSIIEKRITDSFGDVNYKRAIEELGVMRQEMIEMDEPGIWNEYIKGLKAKLLGEELGGERREMWWEIRKNRLGLIEKKTSKPSNVSEEEAKAFLSRK
ncbi:ATP-dependent DNA helicase 2 subunit 2, partial [Lecanoromycetidae sp. Uapishka_2]